MLKILFAGCLGLSPVISTQFTVEMYVAATNREKITKNPYFEVQPTAAWFYKTQVNVNQPTRDPE